MDRASERFAIDRRGFLAGAAALVLWPRLARAAAPTGGSKLPDSTLRLLESSPLVYISPLRADGSESACHAEIWYAWIDGAVIVNTRPQGWRARAVAGGLVRARIWVGDHGRWKGHLGPDNQAFRSAPSFDARARLEKDKALLEQQIAAYGKKYGSDFDRWRDEMRDGIDKGTRILIRYEPAEPAGSSGVKPAGSSGVKPAAPKG
jgi:hypothetical protein